VVEVTDSDWQAAANLLGYRDAEDERDYRLTGAQDKAVKKAVQAFARHRQAGVQQGTEANQRHTDYLTATAYECGVKAGEIEAKATIRAMLDGVEPAVYARYMDDTDSLHVCADGDFGAVALYSLDAIKEAL
jgi:hypothetical protein